MPKDHRVVAFKVGGFKRVQSNWLLLVFITVSIVF